ncbi:MAG: hypothetical protein KDD60_12935 [Bdellovibrionales bacterium]|nr:hypothetical protein [Bdellovibrionales bacterium]
MSKLPFILRAILILVFAMPDILFAIDFDNSCNMHPPDGDEEITEAQISNTTTDIMDYRPCGESGPIGLDEPTPPSSRQKCASTLMEAIQAAAARSVAVGAGQHCLADFCIPGGSFDNKCWNKTYDASSFDFDPNNVTSVNCTQYPGPNGTKVHCCTAGYDGGDDGTDIVIDCGDCTDISCH